MTYIFLPPGIESQMGSYRASDKDPSEHPQKPKKPPSRKNPWGNRSYADLITQAIQNAPEKRLTLSQIYEWMVKNIPHFKDKGENNSSAGWKNSIRHNLSLHTRFVRIQNEGTGKSSWWVIDPTAGEGRATRRRSSNKGDRVRPFRRNRPKLKTEPPKNKGLVAFHSSPFVNNFRQQISQSGAHHDNKYYDGVPVPSYVPFSNPLHLTDSQRQRWHSSSSCSSEEFGCNEVRPYRRFSPEFLQPSPPYSDRSASEISSLSLEHETEDRMDFAVPNQQQAYPNAHHERNSWYKMPSPYCSSEQIQGISHTSGGNFWNDSVQNSASFVRKARILNEDPSLCVQQVNAFLNIKNCDGAPEDMVLEEQKRYNYEYLDDRTCSHDPDYFRDIDTPPLTVIDYSSQHPSEDDTVYYDARGNLQVCGKMADMPTAYRHDSSSDRSDGSNCNLDYLYVLNFESTKLATNEETLLLPQDLRSCEVSTGLDCDIAEIFQLEMDVEGSLEFLENFVPS